MRSSTAETVYAAEGYTVKSAGTENTAREPLSEEVIRWSNLIFAMEEKHKVIINSVFADAAENKSIIVLDIPDDYFYMEKELVDLIKDRVAPHL